MEIIKSLTFQIPIILACVLFFIAAILRMGKEKGATLVLLGAIGMLFMACATPVIYAGIMPKLIENMAKDNIGNIYFAIRLISNIFWASSIALIAIGTFIRPRVIHQQ
ncbi:MAG: hypothetical protein L0958_06100 [Candidatus Mariimomonas ferrooxydans]